MRAGTAALPAAQPWRADTRKPTARLCWIGPANAAHGVSERLGSGRCAFLAPVPAEAPKA
ncbi:hypothetical protein GCM10009416_00040 [Craurococcus roseus]|uniref:Uncharacterized protein n=1 Tax=Craurococcus roseus TaxID=77585 RepID=A0ABN1EGE8_9PROT